jgi:outer membrane protein TolC
MRNVRCLWLIICLSSLGFSEQLSFKRAIELALRNSTASVIADADEKKAKAGYLEMKSQYLPQVTVGAGLAYSHGFPLSLEGAAPAIFNLNSSSYLVNFAGKSFLNAAKTEWGAASKSAQDKRAQVILDTALTYAELDKFQSSLKIIEQQQKAAHRAEQVAGDRFHAGLDPETEFTKARLNSARVRMAAANSRGNADLLRLKLSQLTGLPAETIETVTETIPQLPEGPTAMTKEQIENHPAVQSANEVALGRELRAKGEHKAKLPSVDFAAQYAVLSRFNNYDQFFLKFERHNATVGVVIRFPFLNFAQDARTQAADAEALKAKKEAEVVKGQVASDMLKLQRTVDQLAAARDVAKLEYQLATSDASAALTRVSAGQATVKDQEIARLVEQQKYSAYLDAQFELERAQMTLMRQTGEIEKWVGLAGSQ